MTSRGAGALRATRRASANTTTNPATAKEHEINGQATCRIASVAAGRPTEIRGLNDPQDDLEGVTVTAQFEAFHRRYPRFYDAMVSLAREFRARTGRTCGVQRLIEVVRHDIELATGVDDDFKINNSFAPYYARLMMAREPDLESFFLLRAAPEADQWIAAMAGSVAA